ncbi:hypothetical protein FRX31_026220 [Thalictrum thalictroides]|uniref:Uncharacterized protein n=1 Tax=Thalictrum thalictroides TaxID=46969 RepID=A0A7J6VH17_THATH|nr:hypothetical protein FRX31_026220 [Thalictrum thalictroides]
MYALKVGMDFGTSEELYEYYGRYDLATGNKDKVEKVMRWIKILKDDLIKCEGTSEPSLVPVSQLNTSPITVDISPTVEEINKVRSPLAVPKRGRPPFKRKQSIGEKVTVKEKKKKKTKATNDANSKKTQKVGSNGGTQGCSRSSSTLEVSI